jgi:membrane protease YdiL (CAAX protease family)
MRGPQALRLIGGFAVVFAVFQVAAAALRSERGEWGLLVAALVVGALSIVEATLHGRSLSQAPWALGLGRPRMLGVAVALALSALLLAVVPLYGGVTGSDAVLHSGWLSLLPGLFAQGGVAEEALFRGYLFGHLRRRLPFWRAAGLAAIPFVVAHLCLFATLPVPVAVASILLATVMSFPLSRLYELAGNTIWAAAILHFVVQATPKLVAMPDGASFPLVWIAAGGAIPWLVFLIRCVPQAERAAD